MQMQIVVKRIAGQCLLILDQRNQTVPWCQNVDAKLRQLNIGRNANAGLTFLRHPAFTYDFSISYSKNNTIFGHARCIPFHYLYFLLRTCTGYTFPQPAVWTCRVYPLLLPVGWMCMMCPFLQPAVWMCRVCLFFLMPKMLDCPASGQSGTGMNKSVDASTSPVPE